MDEDVEVGSFDFEEKSEKKTKKSSAKKAKGNEEIEKVFSSQQASDVTEEQKKFIFKILYEAVHNTQNKQLSLEELWTRTTKNKSFNKYSSSKAELLEIVLALDHDGKILFSHDTNEIILI